MNILIMRCSKQALGNEFSLSYANSGASCLTSAIAEPPDAILLDVCMPGLDGYDTCRLLKNTPETAKIPVVMVSGLETELEKKRVLMPDVTPM